MKHEPSEPARDALDRTSAELFAAAASDRAPAGLRAALLARTQLEAEDTAPQPDPPRAPRRSSSRRSVWLALSAAAALVTVVLGWSARRELPRVAPLISAERLPVREPRRAEHEPAEEIAPAAPDELTADRSSEAGGTSGRSEATRARPGSGSALRDAPARPRSVRAPEVAPRRTSTETAPSPALPPPPAPEAAPATPSGPSIALQLTQLEQIRGALRAGANERALALLDEHERATEGGAFAAEARLMRIEALAGARRTREARALAEDFLSRYPNSPLADRARRFAESSAPGAR